MENENVYSPIDLSMDDIFISSLAWFMASIVD